MGLELGAIITLLTDFGLTDGYAAAMKGVMLGINRDVTLIDICHTIPSQNILQAAFVLGTVYQFFPEKTIHLVVVDPGVGTGRRAIILRTPLADFVAPDNGVLSFVIYQSLTGRVADYVSKTQVALEAGLEAVVINKPRFWRSPVSSTFHGRDIFASVAAWLSRGCQPEEFGEKITSLTVLPLPQPYTATDGALVGHILHIDSFGNLITDVRSHDLLDRKAATIEVGEHLITGLSHTYAEGNGLLALIGSSGYLEISLKNGSASDLLKATIGNEIRIRWFQG